MACSTKAPASLVLLLISKPLTLYPIYYPLRDMSFSIIGDCSSSETTDEAEVDARIALIIDMEDPNIVPDLHSLNSGQISR